MPSALTLPHEGVTLEYLCRPISVLLLQPLLTAPLLALNVYKPAEVLKHIPPRILEYLLHPSAYTWLRNIVIAGFVFKMNRYLTRKSLNNWVTDRSWNKYKEIVLITGGNSGLGKAMVDKFAAAGYKVACVDISQPQNKLPANVKFFKADVTNSDAIKAAAAEIRKQMGEPTVLVNNAGVGHAKDVLRQTEAEIKLTIGVNLLSHFLMFREFAPDMIKNNHGHIVTIASMASFLCQASNVDYACTKAAVLAFHEGIGQELAHRYKAPAVRTTVVHPIWVKTALTGPMYDSGKFKELSIEPETVSDAVFYQVEAAEGGQLILPQRLAIASGLRGWPSWLQNRVRNQAAKTLEGYHDMLEEANGVKK